MLARLFGVLVVVTALGGLAAEVRKPLVQIPLGTLRGHWMNARSGRRFYAFSGVPYAQPPVGDLTFQPPAFVMPWSGIRDATKDGPWCLQYNMYEYKPEAFGEQDCLYLSVYTHNLNGRSPVMVHFHGGGFMAGNGANRTGPQYMMDEDVVIVDVNYRVGIFGFLSFEDKVMPGNQGMKDQVMALKWIQENIGNLGGDSNRVTLFGESAGGASVYHHTVSPLSKGLFHGGIAESGSSYCLWCLAPKGFTRNLTMEVLKSLGCSYTTTEQAVECIKGKDPKEVAAKLEIFRSWQIDPIFNFGPVFEEPGPGAFLVGPMSSWKHADVPLLTGMTSAEGLLRTEYFNYFNMSYDWYSENFEKVAPKSLLYFASASNPDNVTKAVRQYYFPNGEITDKDWVNITTMYGDSWFNYAVLEGANNHAGDVYFYYFDYLGNYKWTGDNSTRNDTIVFGAGHTEEIIYIWWYNDIIPLTGKDLEMSNKLVKIWTDFAKYGTPAPRGSAIKWKKWTPERQRYVHINKEGFNMKEGLAEDRYKFWKSTNFMDNYEK